MNASNETLAGMVPKAGTPCYPSLVTRSLLVGALLGALALPSAAIADGVFGLNAFPWEAFNSRQVTFTYYDSQKNEYSLREFYRFGADTRWHCSDLSSLTGAPRPRYANAVAYAWEAGKNKQVVYERDGTLYELYRAGGKWQYANLHLLATQVLRQHYPRVTGVGLSAYPWETRGTKHVVAKSTDAKTRNHIVEFSVGADGKWRFKDLTQATGAPLPSIVSKLVGYAWEEGGTKQVVYLDMRRHIIELYSGADGKWRWADLSEITPGALGQALPRSVYARFSAYAWKAGRSKQIVYLAEDGHIHELYAGIGYGWRHADLTVLSGAPAPVPDGDVVGYAWEAGKAKQVVYVAEDDKIHELYAGIGYSWRHADLTDATRSGNFYWPADASIAGAIDGYAAPGGGTKHVVFRSSQGHLFSLDLDLTTRAWRYGDFTQYATGPYQSIECRP